MQYLVNGQIMAITIGGNHSREACTRLIRSGDLDENFTTRCDVFIGIKPEDARAIGFIDNLVSTDNLAYSLLDKVTMIRDLWNNPAMLTNEGKLNLHAGTVCVKDILYKDKEAAGGPRPTVKKQIQSANPMIKSCKVPESCWPTVRTALSKNKIPQTEFRNISWESDETRLKAAFRDFSNKSDVPAWKARIKFIRIRAKLVTALERAYHVIPAAKQFASSPAGFVTYLEGQIKIDTLCTTFEKELAPLNHNQTFASNELHTMIKKILEDAVAETTESQAAKPSVSCVNKDGAKSSHHFKIGSCKNAFQSLSKKNFSVGLTFIDPPFGILDEDWDVLWNDDFWHLLFAGALQHFPKAPIVVFVAEEQLSQVVQCATTCGFDHWRIYSWLKTGHFIHQAGRLCYPANLILLFWHKTLNWNGEQASFSQNGNFVCTPAIPKYKQNGEPLNSTEKPVILLRSFISSFCPVGKTVLDLTCGSGSVAMAAASLARDSFCYDLRESQIEGALSRVQAESSRPSWYPPPDTVHQFKALDNALKVEIAEPLEDDASEKVSELKKKSPKSDKSKPRQSKRQLDKDELAELKDSDSIHSDESISEDEVPKESDNEFVVGPPVLDDEDDEDYLEVDLMELGEEDLRRDSLIKSPTPVVITSEELGSLVEEDGELEVETFMDHSPLLENSQELYKSTEAPETPEGVVQDEEELTSVEVEIPAPRKKRRRSAITTLTRAPATKRPKKKFVD